MSDELDIERPGELEVYLRRAGRVAAGERVSVTTLAGGVSNRTVLVERDGGESWVVKQALPKLRVAVDWFSDVRRIEREALGMKALAELAPPGTITRLVFEDPDHHLLAMEAVPRPHENWKAMLMAGRVQTEHVEQFGALLAAIHRHSAEAASQFAPLFDDRSFFESLRVEPYYAYSAQQVPDAADFLSGLIDATRKCRVALAHGDYSPKNVLVREGRLVLLDHEVIHWGDPAFDVGFALAHLLSKAHHHVRWRDRFLKAAFQFCEVYAAILGPAYWTPAHESFAVQHLLGCLLARAAGRSQLEYLTPAEKAAQIAWASGGMRSPPQSPRLLIEMFAWTIGPSNEPTDADHSAP